MPASFTSRQRPGGYPARLLVAAFALVLAACSGRDRAPAAATPTALTAPISLVTARPSPYPPATPSATPAATTAAATVAIDPTATLTARAGCPLGIGLNSDTVALLEKYAASDGLVMAASAELAGAHFPGLEGWFRVLGAPGLDALRQKAERALADDTPYEALAYGLETGPGSPDEEWQDLAGSAARAAALGGQFGKILILGPGFQLMTRNSDAYAPMAQQTDMWLLQTQQLQKGPPGEAYREAVRQLVAQIRATNPDIEVWAQITLPPDREPDAYEWLAYRAAIEDLVAGTYVGVYTWDKVDTGQLLAVLDTIFAAVCGEIE
jgi:hypothetical protein